jgi:hypothetical protein
MVSEGEGIQYACGQFEHAIDSVNLARVKRKEKKKGKHGCRSISRSNKQRFTKDAERRVVATRERSPLHLERRPSSLGLDHGWVHVFQTGQTLPARTPPS